MDVQQEWESYFYYTEVYFFAL